MITGYWANADRSLVARSLVHLQASPHKALCGTTFSKDSAFQQTNSAVECKRCQMEVKA